MEDNYEFSEDLKFKKRPNSKKKGSSFERKVCQVLNDYFKTTEFCRSPNSGAFATTHNLPEYLKIYGDIITPKEFKFCIEAKRGYSDINISDLFNKKSKFWEFIEQAERDSRKSHKPYLLIWQQDRGRILCVLPKTYSLIVENHLNFGIINIIALEELLKLNNVTNFYN
jgi:hypothetical protein